MPSMLALLDQVDAAVLDVFVGLDVGDDESLGGPGRRRRQPIERAVGAG